MIKHLLSGFPLSIRKPAVKPGKEMERIDLVILAATPGEIAPLATFLAPVNSVSGAGRRTESSGPAQARLPALRNQLLIYIYKDIAIAVATTGIGKVNAAAVTAALLSGFEAGLVLNVGCAGAYEESGLAIGDVLIVDNCICADEGILEKEGPIPTSSLGIPLVIKKGRSFYDCFPLDEFLAGRRIRDLLPTGAYGSAPSGNVRKGRPFKVQYGPSLTVGMTSGDIETARARFRGFGALAENMEASAIAQTCVLFDTPFLEIRGISNMAGVRDKAQWNIGAAIENCCVLVKCLLDKGCRTEAGGPEN